MYITPARFGSNSFTVSRTVPAPELQSSLLEHLLLTGINSTNETIQVSSIAITKLNETDVFSFLISTFCPQCVHLDEKKYGIPSLCELMLDDLYPSCHEKLPLDQRFSTCDAAH